jgi:hypothetical protein
MSAGRPRGHVRLMDDPGRFEVAAWLAFTEAGLGPYEAAYAVTFLLTSDKPITTESIEGLRLISSTGLGIMVTPKGHSDRVRRKSEEVIKRADDDERGWLQQSAGLIAALVKAIPQLPESRPRVELILELLRNNGWADVILRVSRRIDASLQFNFPPHQDKLSRTAERMLRQLRAQEK